ncbi:hypothetical protein P618_201129 [Holospora obtusa F1]|uniref:Uncharacterized protein n=1 Tax=Holospora obtusa F1 TaxID=1399147 RepID=W6TD02_HOLOB|nr:IS1 transposase [Holospora obtusa]ETZ06723.1 hypothetical protein P618_201129 [Holospora obtusa F1]
MIGMLSLKFYQKTAIVLKNQELYRADNSNTRHHLGRMTRPTKVVSKKEFMVYGSIKLWCALTTPEIFNHYEKTFLSLGENSQK